MKRFVVIIYSVSILLLTGLTDAAINIDVKGSVFEILSQDTIRVHHVTVQGYGIYWADLRWDPNLMTLVLINYGAENPNPPPPVQDFLMFLSFRIHNLFKIVASAY